MCIRSTLLWIWQTAKSMHFEFGCLPSLGILDLAYLLDPCYFELGYPSSLGTLSLTNLSDNVTLDLPDTKSRHVGLDCSSSPSTSGLTCLLGSCCSGLGWLPRPSTLDLVDSLVHARWTWLITKSRYLEFAIFVRSTLLWTWLTVKSTYLKLG
jgi:hypothetical protein